MSNSLCPYVIQVLQSQYIQRAGKCSPGHQGLVRSWNKLQPIPRPNWHTATKGARSYGQVIHLQTLSTVLKFTCHEMHPSIWTFFNLSSHHIEKRKCNTATCVTQRLADFLVRSSNTIGTVYAPTNVGSATYGKRDLLQPPSYLPL